MKLYIDDLRDPVKYLTPEEAEGIIWKKEWWEARNFLFDNEAVLEVIHFDHYLNDPDNHTGGELFGMVASYCAWGGDFKNLKQVYLHSNDKDIVEELYEQWYKELAAVGVTIIKRPSLN